MTVANALTLLRIFLLVPFVGMFYLKTSWAHWAAMGLYLFACLTDYFDGALARKLKQVSSLGRFLDPIADKLLIATAIIMLAGTGRLTLIELIPSLIILARELFISGLREHLSLENMVIPVSSLAKWKTVTQMVSLSYFLADFPRTENSELCGIILLWGAAIFSLVTGYVYWRKGWPVLNA